jgi:hypothetical protein
VQYFKCHGNCGAYGDVIDFVGYMKISGYNKLHPLRRDAAELLGGEVKFSPPKPPPPPKPMATYLWRNYLPMSERVRVYCLERGILKEQIEQFKLGGKQDWLSIPTFHGEKLMGIKLRNITEKGLRYTSVKGSKKGLWGYNDVVNQDKTVYVVKGEIAAIVMRRFGFLSCAPTAGEGANVNREPLAFANIIVIGDNDKDEDISKATRAQAEERSKELRGKLVFPPSKYKDVDEWILDDPDGAIEQIKLWEAQTYEI